MADVFPRVQTEEGQIITYDSSNTVDKLYSPLRTTGCVWVDGTEGDDSTGIVSREDRPFKTIGAAVAAASSGQVIRIRPGTYVEDPLTIPTGVSLLGEEVSSTLLTPSNNTVDFIVITGQSTLQGLTLYSPTGAGKFAVKSTSSGLVDLNHCRFVGTSSASNIVTNAGTGSMSLSYSPMVSGTCSVFFDAVSGDSEYLSTDWDSLTVSKAFRVSSGDLRVSLVHVKSNTLSTFVEVNGTGECVINSCYLEDVDVVVHITADDHEVFISDCIFHDINTWDFLVDSGVTSGYFNVLPSFLESAKISLPSSYPPSAYNFVLYDNIADDSGFKIWGELNVGHAEQGSESVFGEGDSYTRGMKVYTTDSNASATLDGGNLTDVSVAAADPTNNTFSFQGTGINHTILVGSTLLGASEVLKHWGLKVKQTTGASVTDIRSFAVEIWNGSAWEEVGVMATHSSAFYSYGNVLFLRSNNSEHLRYGITNDNTWVKKTINGDNLYWSRIRITTALVSAPVFQQFKLHSSRFEINSDGTNTFHGHSRFRVTLSQSGNVFGESGGVNAVNFTVGSGTTDQFSWTHAFKNVLLGGSGDAIYTQFQIPFGTDTSLPMGIRVVYRVSNSVVGTGTVRLGFLPAEVEGVKVADPSGGVLLIPRSLTNTQTFTSNAAQSVDLSANFAVNNKLQIIEYLDFDISNFYPGDFVFVRIELDDDGSPNNDIAVVNLELTGHRWKHGDRI